MLVVKRKRIIYNSSNMGKKTKKERAK